MREKFKYVKKLEMLERKGVELTKKYTMDSPFTGGARGFSRGAIYDQSGKLVASVAQEGLIRPIKLKNRT